MQIEVICTEVRASESGQNVRLALPRQAPKPAVDGEGNPVGHPPPLSATVALFVTSPEREALLYKIDPLRRQLKKSRPELATDDATREALTARSAALTKEIAGLCAKLDGCKEIKFEQGGKYVLKLEKAGK